MTNLEEGSACLDSPIVWGRPSFKWINAGAFWDFAFANNVGSVDHGRVFGCGVPRNKAVVGLRSGAVGGATTVMAFLGRGIVAF